MNYRWGPYSLRQSAAGDPSRGEAVVLLTYTREAFAHPDIEHEIQLPGDVGRAVLALAEESEGYRTAMGEEALKAMEAQGYRFELVNARYALIQAGRVLRGEDINPTDLKELNREIEKARNGG